MQMTDSVDIMGRTEKVFSHPSALSNDLDWRSSVPSEDSTTRLIPLSNGKFAIVDAADFDWLTQWKWYAIKREGRGDYWYASRSFMQCGRSASVRMHRIILDAPRHFDVDHENGDGLDNRRSNLRLATKRQNNANRKSRNSKTGFKGVAKIAKMEKFKAHIGYDNKIIHLGSFDSPEEAAHAYDAKAKELFGEFANLNFPEARAGQRDTK